MMTCIDLKKRCLSSVTTCTVAGMLLVLGWALHQTQANPLVYPNRFSFQKTTTTSSTPAPKNDHDHSNKSISSAVSNSTNESGMPTDRGFQYGVAAWVVGVLIFIGFMIVLFYPKGRVSRDDEVSSSSFYVFPPQNDLKVETDSVKIISR